MTKFKHHILKLIFICIISSYCFTSVGQVFDFLEGKDKVSIPFEYSHNFLLIEARFQNVVPLTLMFDTGAEHTILFDKVYTELFNIPYDRKIKIYGADLSQELFANVARNVRLAIDGIANIPRDIVVLDEDYYHLKEITGINIDGIISTSFFNNMVIKIDFKKGLLTLYNPATFKAPKNFTECDVEFFKRKPYINTTAKLQNGTSLDLKLLIDSGAALPLLLHANSHSSLEIPENVITGKLGVGLGGSIEGFMGRIKSLNFSDFNFSEIITSFQDLSESKLAKNQVKRNGLIGTQILSRFTIIFNPITQKVYFKPRKSLKKAFKFDKSGMIIYAFGPNLNDYVVQGIIPNSAAELAGIQVGDKIKRVGIVSTNFMKLSDLLLKFQKKAGKKIKLKIQRGEDIIHKRLILKDLL
jgi:hypothetical protein